MAMGKNKHQQPVNFQANLNQQVFVRPKDKKRKKLDFSCELNGNRGLTDLSFRSSDRYVAELICN
jgi:hypothetical protein